MPCVSQVVPLVYYPLFFSLTGIVQGLTIEDTIARAREKFLPLVQRNLQFWLPVQIVQFEFVPEELQAIAIACPVRGGHHMPSIVTTCRGWFASHAAAISPGHR